MKQINILQVVGAMNMGGAETFLMNVLRNIDRDKYRFVFLCYIKTDEKYAYEDEIVELGGKIIRIPDDRVKRPLRFLKNIETVIADEAIDVIHSHVDASTGYAMLSAKKCGVKKRIAHSHSQSLTNEKNFLRKLPYTLLKASIRRCATNHLACEQAAGKSLFGNKIKFQVIKNGINVERFMYDAKSRKQIRQALKVSDNKKVILHIGRFEKPKNHLYLIDIFAALCREDSNLVLILAGNGSLLASVKHRVQELRLEKNVVFLNNVYDIEKYYSVADVFAMPSLYEGLPVSMIEAQANGLKCFVSDRVDRKVDISGEVTFVSLESIDEWKTSIANVVLGYDRRNTDARVEQYNVSNVAKQLEKIYGA